MPTTKGSFEGSVAGVDVITFDAATGVNEIVIPTNLAEGLVVRDSAADILVLETTTGTPVFKVTPATTVTGATTINGVLKQGPSASAAELAPIKGICLSAVVAVTIPSIADGKVDQVDVDISTALTMVAAAGDVVIPIAQEALMTSAVVLGAQIIGTDSARVTFGCIEGGTVTGAAKNFKFLIIDLT